MLCFSFLYPTGLFLTATFWICDSLTPRKATIVAVLLRVVQCITVNSACRKLPMNCRSKAMFASRHDVLQSLQPPHYQAHQVASHRTIIWAEPPPPPLTPTSVKSFELSVPTAACPYTFSCTLQSSFQEPMQRDVDLSEDYMSQPM